MSYILVGNYGVGNLGDEALKEYFLSAFTDIEWVVLSAHPKARNEVHRLPGGVRSFLCTNWLKTIGEIRASDGLVFGGGSLFTDVESVYACFLWWIHASVARLLGKKIFLAFQGIGPFSTGAGEWFARKVVQKSVFISVRDDISFERVKKWRLNTNIVQTFDPAFALFINKKMTTNTKNVFTIIPRHNSGDLLKSETSKQILIHKNCTEVQIILMQSNDAAELNFSNTLAKNMTIPAKVVPMLSINQLMDNLSQSSFVLTQRFHGALAALAAGVDVKILPQSAGDKLSGLIPYASGRRSTGELQELIGRGEDALRKELLRANGDR